MARFRFLGATRWLQACLGGLLALVMASGGGGGGQGDSSAAPVITGQPNSTTVTAGSTASRLGTAPAEASAPARRPRVQPAEPPVAPAPLAENREAPALTDLTPEAIRQAHREVLAAIPSPLSEDNLLRAVAHRLGFQRLGGRIKARIQASLPMTAMAQER